MLSTGNFSYPPLVAPAGKVRADKCPHHIQSDFFTDKTRRNRKYVRVIVLASEAGEFFRPAECAANALVFIGGNCRAVSAAAEDDAEVGFSAFHIARRRVYKVRIINGVFGVRTKIVNFDAFFFQHFDNRIFIGETAVVAADGYGFYLHNFLDVDSVIC